MRVAYGPRSIDADCVSHEEIGTRIKEARLRQEMTQDDLARLVGVKTNTVSRWEQSGAHSITPNLKKLDLIAKALHVSAAWLTYGVSDSVVEGEDSAGWLAAVKAGDVDAARRMGVPEHRLENVRRDYFVGGAGVEAVRERLRSEVLIATRAKLDEEAGPEAPELVAARRRRKSDPIETI